MLKQILATVSFNAPLHIPDVPDIESLTNISISSISDLTHPPKHEHLHRHLPPEKEERKKWFHTRNI